MTSVAGSCGAGDQGRAMVAGMLRGYRTWRLAGRTDPRGGLPLTAVTRRDVRWQPEMRATCVRPADGAPIMPEQPPGGGHVAPAGGCECGLYGWYQPDDTAILAGNVFGVIEASGVVILGERGFRAERARVRAVATRRRRVAARCEAAGVEVYRSRRALVRAYPPDDVRELLGEPVRAEQGLRLPAAWSHRRSRQVLLAAALPGLYIGFAAVAAHGAPYAVLGFLLTQLAALALLFVATR